MRRSYVTAKRLAELEALLSDRDQAILVTLAWIRMASGDQLWRLHGVGVTTRQMRAILMRLVDRRLVVRLPRVVGGVRAGSAGFVYTLDAAGQRLAQPDVGRSARPWTVGTAFLAHSLLVSELYVRLIEAQRAGLVRVADFSTEPVCWRPFVGPSGARVVLKPDAAMRLRLGRYEDLWLIEVDRGTESTTAIARKADRYRQAWQAGAGQAEGGVFPRVLWTVPDTQRYQALVDVLGRQPAESWRLHVVTLFDDIVPRLAAGAAS